MKRFRLWALLLVMVFLMAFVTGCNNKYFQINPSTDAERYEALGLNIGAYYKIKSPDSVSKTETWVKGVLKMTDEQMISGNIIQVAYEFLLEENSEDAEMILLVKSALDVFGVSIKVNAGELPVDLQSKYVTCARAFFSGYAKGAGIQLT